MCYPVNHKLLNMISNQTLENELRSYIPHLLYLWNIYSLPSQQGTQHGNNVDSTSRRWINVVSTLCARWDNGPKIWTNPFYCLFIFLEASELVTNSVDPEKISTVNDWKQIWINCVSSRTLSHLLLMGRNFFWSMFIYKNDRWSTLEKTQL